MKRGQIHRWSRKYEGLPEGCEAKRREKALSFCHVLGWDYVHCDRIVVVHIEEDSEQRLEQKDCDLHDGDH